MQALFPDSTYGVDSGGDPTVIPNLTFQQFQVFFVSLWVDKQINVPSYCWSRTRQVQDVGVSMLFVVIFFLARSMVHFSPHETVLCV